jgi:small subunit ribosomal protein S17
VLTGVVTSSGRDKTIRVDVSRLVPHRKYGKYLRRRTRLHAHDPNNEARDGDVVEVTPCRPISKTKSWRLVRIVRRAPGGAAAGVGEA